MKRREFKEYVKLMMLEVLQEEDFQEELFEVISSNMGVIKESANSKPADVDLWENLSLIASGKLPFFKKNGKKIQAPSRVKNKKQWINEQYRSLGGKFIGETSFAPQSGGNSLNNDTMEFLRAMGGADGETGTLTEDSIRSKGISSVPVLDENLNIVPGQTIDLTDIMMDTARTTLVEQDNASNTPIQASDKADLIVSQSDPSELFAESAGKWEDLAF